MTTQARAAERTVGGLSCSEVLERLSAYIDGELTSAERAHVDTHLHGCDACTRFGGEFGALVKALRTKLGAADDEPSTQGR